MNPNPRDREEHLAAAEDLRAALRRMWDAGSDEDALMGEARFATEKVIEEWKNERSEK